MKIAVFASGNGSNFQVIAEQFPVEFVFSDHRDAYVLERAKKLGVLTYAFELKEFENKADYEGAIVELLDEHQIDLVCLAGYMKIVGPTLLVAYEGRIINIHPAYLPEFPGATKTFSTSFDSSNFLAIACSRPPEPTTNSFITQPLLRIIY